MKKRWLLAWVGTPVLAIVNGGTREALYTDAVGDDAAHAISTGTLLGLLGGYMWILQRRWPLESRREALSVGSTWAALAIAFEFGFGHWVEGESWSTLVANYEVTAGKVWILVPAALAVGPDVVRRLAAHERPDPGYARTSRPGLRTNRVRHGLVAGSRPIRGLRPG